MAHGWFTSFFLNLSINANQRLYGHGFGLRIEDLGEQGLVIPTGLEDDLHINCHIKRGFSVSLQAIDWLHNFVPFQKQSLPSIPSITDGKVMITINTIDNLLQRYHQYPADGNKRGIIEKGLIDALRR